MNNAITQILFEANMEAYRGSKKSEIRVIKKYCKRFGLKFQIPDNSDDVVIIRKKNKVKILERTPEGRWVA